MGQEVVGAVRAQPDLELVGVLDLPDKAGTEFAGVNLAAGMEALLATGPHVLVDFTRFDSAPSNLRAALQAGVSTVVGTTGIPDATLTELGQLAEAHGACCFVAPNFSVGAVLMMQFAREAARHFEWAEIIELHHEKKIDAPSGTAMRTADLMRQARGKAFATPSGETLKLESARGGLKEGIHIHSVRLPGYVAHQEVLLGGEGEVLTLRHDSTHRNSFMPGVVLAVRRVRDRRGLVVGLENFL
jgi:4-hydroxy-tetrahydrodipicolinate reductase